MAEVKLQIPFDEIHGAIEKHGIISRQKKYRDDSGRVIFEGKQEAYAVRRPRDFKKDPPKGEELKHQNRWKEACHRAAQILQAGQPKSVKGTSQDPDLTPEVRRSKAEVERVFKATSHIPDYYSPEEALQLYNAFKSRYEKQIPNIRGKRPDPQAQIDPLTRLPKRYHLFPAFLRAMLYIELKAQNL